MRRLHRRRGGRRVGGRLARPRSSELAEVPERAAAAAVGDELARELVAARARGAVGAVAALCEGLTHLGAGAVMAGLTAAIPGIMWLSTHKNILFVLSGGLMAASTLLWWQQRYAPCPVDPIKAASCARLRRINVWLLSGAWVAYVTGVFFAYIWLHIFY